MLIVFSPVEYRLGVAILEVKLSESDQPLSERSDAGFRDRVTRIGERERMIGGDGEPRDEESAKSAAVRDELVVMAAVSVNHFPAVLWFNVIEIDRERFVPRLHLDFLPRTKFAVDAFLFGERGSVVLDSGQALRGMFENFEIQNLGLVAG